MSDLWNGCFLLVSFYSFNSENENYSAENFKESLNFWTERKRGRVRLNTPYGRYMQVENNTSPENNSFKGPPPGKGPICRVKGDKRERLQTSHRLTAFAQYHIARNFGPLFC